MIKILLWDLAIAAAAVFIYSPGLLGANLQHENIFVAGLSILAIPALIYAFYLVNIKGAGHKVAIRYNNFKVKMDADIGSRILELQNKTAEVHDAQIRQMAERCIDSIIVIYGRVYDNRALKERQKDEILDNLHHTLDFYIDALSETLDKYLTLEKYWKGTPKDQNNYDKTVDILKTLEGFFGFIQDKYSSGDLISNRDLIDARTQLDGYFGEYM